VTMPARPLTRLDLDGVHCCECGDPDCGEDFFIRSGCHKDTPLWAHYQDGVLHLECADCESVIARIAVAELPS
jgi:hypothetical protein